MRAVVVIALACACRFDPRDVPGLGDDASPPVVDAAADAAPDAMLAACPPAPSGCTLFSCTDSTSCYYACSTQRTWSDARDRCVQDQIGCLATIESESENSCIFANTNPVFPDLLWFGYKQPSEQATPLTGWEWECGASSFVAPNWGGSDPFSEPNDGTENDGEDDDENCASMGQGSAWIDIDCDTPERYVCELTR
jgi:hypothetical protein